MDHIRKIGQFYTRNIMKSIGVFLFIGILYVIFHQDGWFPNEEMYRISQTAYVYAVPLLIAYECGTAIGNIHGGILAVLGVCGFLTANTETGMFGAMVCGPAGGWIWNQVNGYIEKKIPSGIQMLIRNLSLAIEGAVLAGLGFYAAAPLIDAFDAVLFCGVSILVENKLTGLLSLVIEPAKVFFFNNLMNHGILVPLGMSQVQEMGSSVLFLLESNPGPGLGILTALYLRKKQERNDYAAAMFVQGVGGIHEVYFPYILSNLRLLVPLILGGMAGGFWFAYMQCGLQGAVSPGSVLIIVMMAGKRGWTVFAGILLSAVVSFAGSMILTSGKKADSENVEKEAERGGNAVRMEHHENRERKDELMHIQTIGFVCDGGMGSSAMGAALFRRVLQEQQIEGIEVKAYASDLIPKEIDLLVCQKDFCQIRAGWQDDQRIYVVENFVNKEGYEELAEKLKGGD